MKIMLIVLREYFKISLWLVPCLVLPFYFVPQEQHIWIIMFWIVWLPCGLSLWGDR